MLAATAAAFLFAACSSAGEPGQQQSLVVFAATSDTAIGANRVPLNIQLIDGTRYDDRAGDLQVTYSPPDSEEEFVVDDLTWRPWPIRSGIYTATMTFDRVGLWNIKISSKTDESLLPASSGVLVKSATEAPNIGDPAPLSVTKVAESREDLKKITSDPNPDFDLYQISFDDAVASKKPTVITFSTPAYCQSGTCGPQTRVLGQLEETHRENGNFIHVEIFDNPDEMLAAGDPSLGIEAPVIHEWNFNTEPWTFIVDSDGIVRGRYEAFVSKEEIEETFLPLLIN
jgi:hypothetical protein